MDWNAIGALATAGATAIALMIWLSDSNRRTRERAATKRLLAQVMLTPVGVAQLQIAKFRTAIVPPDGSTSVVQELASSHRMRKSFADNARLVKIDLPPLFLERADLFGEVTSNRLAYALSQVSRLHSAWEMLGDLTDSAEGSNIDKHLEVALIQVKESEATINEAFHALLNEGRALDPSSTR